MNKPVANARTAKELAEKLVTPLEMIANLRYLIDREADAKRQAELQEAELHSFNRVIQEVLDCLTERDQPGPGASQK